MKINNKNDNYLFEEDNIPDKETVDSSGRKLSTSEETKFHTKLLPQPLAGDLEKGKIFICVLNLGFGDKDYDDEIIIKEELWKQLNQNNASMFWLKKDFKDTGGGQYWRKKFDQNDKKKSLIENILKEYVKNSVDIDKEEVFNMLSKIVVDLELIPYHSKKCRKTKAVKELKSVKNMLDYVHNDLIQNAEENQQIVCFVRSIRDWKVTNEEKNLTSCVFCNEINGIGLGNFTLNVNLPLGNFVFNHIRKLTNDFKEIL